RKTQVRSRWKSRSRCAVVGATRASRHGAMGIAWRPERCFQSSEPARSPSVVVRAQTGGVQREMHALCRTAFGEGEDLLAEVTIQFLRLLAQPLDQVQRLVFFQAIGE